MSPHFTYAMDSKSVLFREWLDGKGTYEKLPDGRLKRNKSYFDIKDRGREWRF
jgi:hypothetical protein